MIFLTYFQHAIQNKLIVLYLELNIPTTTPSYHFCSLRFLCVIVGQPVAIHVAIYLCSCLCAINAGRTRLIGKPVAIYVAI